MSPLIDFIFDQYSSYENFDIALEIIAVIFGFLSVWFSKENKIWVFPTGMISTAIFVYLLLKWGLLGDMMINAYYFAMSIYGWFIWTRKVDLFKGAERQVLWRRALDDLIAFIADAYNFARLDFTNQLGPDGAEGTAFGRQYVSTI